MTYIKYVMISLILISVKFAALITLSSLNLGTEWLLVGRERNRTLYRNFDVLGWSFFTV